MESVSIGLVSLDLLTDSLKKCLLLIGRQEVERAGKRPQPTALIVPKNDFSFHPIQMGQDG